MCGQLVPQPIMLVRALGAYVAAVLLNSMTFTGPVAEVVQVIASGLALLLVGLGFAFAIRGLFEHPRPATPRVPLTFTIALAAGKRDWRVVFAAFR